MDTYQSNLSYIYIPMTVNFRNCLIYLASNMWMTLGRRIDVIRIRLSSLGLLALLQPRDKRGLVEELCAPLLRSHGFFLF